MKMKNIKIALKQERRLGSVIRAVFGAFLLCIIAFSGHALSADADLWREFAHPVHGSIHPLGAGAPYAYDDLFTDPPVTPVQHPLLIILLEFPDAIHRSVHESDLWDQLVFGPSPAPDLNSVVEMIEANSNGLVQLVPATAGDEDGNANGVVGWTASSMNTDDPFWTSEGFNEEGPMKGRAEALRVADVEFNFSLYDNDNNGLITHEELAVYVIFSSPTTCRSGPAHNGHSNPTGCTPSNPGIARLTYPREVEVDGGNVKVSLLIGGGAASTTNPSVKAHELGHMIWGLGDLYPCGSSQTVPDGYTCSNGQWYPPDPGRLSMMSNTFDDPIPHLDPWAKIHLGFTRPAIVDRDGQYTLHDAESIRNFGEQGTEPEAIIIYDPLNSNPYQQYYILENRTQDFVINSSNCGGTRDLLDQGLLVWQINESQTDARKAIRIIRHNGYWGATCDNSSAWDGSDTDYYDLSVDSLPRDTDWADGTNSFIEIYDISPAGPSMTFKVRMPPIFVDQSHVGTETGSQSTPFDTVQEAVSAVPEPPRTIRIAGGSYPEAQTISTSVTLMGWKNGNAILGN